MSSSTEGAVPTVVIVGATASTTVTLKVVDAELPDASIVDTVTVLTPTSEQVNVEALYSTDGLLEQLSEAVAVPTGIVTTPLLVRLSVISDTAITGDVLSTTLIAFVAIDVFPEASVAVIVTVTEPKSLQSTELGETDITGVAVQLSTADAKALTSTLAEPFASNTTSTGVETTVIEGASSSTTEAVMPL